MIEPTIIKFESIESTSDLLKTYADAFPNFTIVSAGFQSKGRGQFDHIWESNPNENLLLSILLKNVKNDSKHIKTIVLDILFKFFHSHDIQVRFKEPNDIFVLEDKICGILIETSYQNNHLEYVVIGIGMNVNQLSFTGFPAISMKKLKNKTYDIDQLFDDLLEMFKKQFSNLTE